MVGSSGRYYNPKEAISREQVIRAYTYWSAFAEFAEMRGGASGKAVSTVIVGVDCQPGRNQEIDHCGIAAHVLAHTVRDLNNRAGWTATVPARARDAKSIRAGQSKPLGRCVRGVKSFHGTSPALLVREGHRP